MNSQRAKKSRTAIEALYYISAAIVLDEVFISVAAVALVINNFAPFVIIPHLAMFGIQNIPLKYSKTRFFLTCTVDLCVAFFTLIGVLAFFDDEAGIIVGVLLLIYATSIFMSPFVFYMLLYGDSYYEVYYQSTAQYYNIIANTPPGSQPNYPAPRFKYETLEQPKPVSLTKSAAVYAEKPAETPDNKCNFAVDIPTAYRITENTPPGSQPNYPAPQSKYETLEQPKQASLTTCAAVYTEKPAETPDNKCNFAVGIPTAYQQHTDGVQIKNEPSERANEAPAVVSAPVPAVDTTPVKGTVPARGSDSELRDEYLHKIYKSFIVPKYYEVNGFPDDDASDYFNLRAEDSTMIMQSISIASSQKYKPEFRALGLYNETTYVSYKAREIICEVIIQKYGSSDSPYDMLAVAKAYDEKSLYGMQSAAEYLISYFDDASDDVQAEIQQCFSFGGIYDNEKRLVQLLCDLNRFLDAFTYASFAEEKSDGSSFDPAQLLGNVYLYLDPVNCVGYYESLLMSGKYKSFTADIKREYEYAKNFVESNRKFSAAEIKITDENIKREENLRKAAGPFAASIQLP